MHDRVQAAALVPPARRRREADRRLDRRPCAEAADLRGINRLMTDFFDDPAFVRDLFDFVLAMGLGFARAQVDAGRGPDRRRRRRRLAGRPANLRGVRPALREEAGRRPARDGHEGAAAHLRQHPPHPAGRRQPGLRDGRHRLDGAAGRRPGRRWGRRRSWLGNIDPVKTLRNGTPDGDHGGHRRVPSPGRAAVHRRRRLRGAPRHARGQRPGAARLCPLARRIPREASRSRAVHVGVARP